MVIPLKRLITRIYICVLSVSTVVGCSNPIGEDFRDVDSIGLSETWKDTEPDKSQHRLTCAFSPGAKMCTLDGAAERRVGHGT